MNRSCDAIVIGRNEGQRLIDCLSSLKDRVGYLVYVDSGSTDGSVAVARGLGADVVDLDTSIPFTAARARNAGLARLDALGSPARFVQFVDGDCQVQPGWIDTAETFLNNTPAAAVVCGRRRERFPRATLYNRLIDIEWDTPVGQAKSCGGDALMRRNAVQTIGGYRDTLIAGEEPELCVRLRQAGWEVWRIDAEMTLHDAAITRFSQWWQRSKRAGHAYAEGAALHGAPPERHKVAQTRSALAWGLTLPLGAVLTALLLSPWLAFVVLAIYPAQVLRLVRKTGDWPYAVFLTLGKFPEALGVLSYWQRRLRGQRATLIEYKSTP